MVWSVTSRGLIDYVCHCFGWTLCLPFQD